MARTKPKHPKYIFVVGGVMSGVGKGVSTSSIGTILQSKGYQVSLIKADPYLNVDAGTMNPTEHGEVFVLESGLETDQDMGNYERFLNRSLPADNYMTNGMVFKYVIDKERALGYNGKCVEPTFHITEEILRRIDVSAEKTKADITIIEIGGTVGEYQNAIFLEAGRQLKLRRPNDVLFVMASYLPIPSKLGEMKTKPTQNAVIQLNSYGINPNIIIARSELPVDKKRKEKIATMTGVPSSHVISAPDVESIYQVPINFEKDGLGDTILRLLDLPNKKKDLVSWRAMVRKMVNSKTELHVAVVGKYFTTGDFVLSDAYISVLEALKFSAGAANRKVVVSYISAADFERGKRKLSELNQYDGVLIPGGFGKTGIEGKLSAIKYVREKGIPYFGLCYGMQLMVIEFARSVLGYTDAHTREIDPKAKHLVIDVMEDQRENIKEGRYGGTMRLGTYPAVISERTHAYRAYKKRRVTERHRHRYEVNPMYIDELEAGGFVFSGKSPDGTLMEIGELPKSEHPFFVGVQFHPEFTARPLDPHPLFSAFIKAADARRKERGK